MSKDRIIIIGDIHGCIDEFNELLKQISFNFSQDRLILLGDLIDRGPDSVSCVKKAQELGAEIIRGNHEDRLIRWTKYEKRRSVTGEKNPMRKPSPQRLREWSGFSTSDIDFIASWPSVIKVNEFWTVVHAGFEPDRTIEEQRPDKILRIRFVDEKTNEMVPYKYNSLSQPSNTVRWPTRWKGSCSVVYGHHVFPDIQIDNFNDNIQCVGLDTGAVFGGNLSAMVLVEDKPPGFVQVQAKAVYHPPLTPQNKYGI